MRQLGQPAQPAPLRLRAHGLQAGPHLAEALEEAQRVGEVRGEEERRGVREELVHGTTGLLVPVRDSAALATALNQLVADSDERARMGAEGLARARALYDESHVLDRQIDHLALRRTGG